MRHTLLLAGLSFLAGCDAADRTAPREAAASAPAAEKTAQASIMRPEIATPATAPPPLEPLELTIGFPDGGVDLGPAQIARLAALVATPQVAQGGAIRLAGHTDSAGTDAANLAASRKRAEAVRDWLIERGIVEERISIIAFGEQNPRRPNALPDGTPNKSGRAANRRVEISVPVAAAPSAEPRQPTLAEEIVESTSQEAAPPLTRENND